MEYSPPPLFKQGAPARVKAIVFALISLVLLVVDARYHTLGAVRQVAATVLYPLQMAALMPREAVGNMGGYFSSISTLQREVRELKTQQLAQATVLQQAQYQQAENLQLRRLMDARQHLPVKAQMTEILYDARDPSTRRIVIDRGSRNDVVPGLPVIDHAGVVGQVTRVYPFTSEVTLLTDKEQAIPVQVLRSGLRSIAYGRGQSGLLDLRFVVANADIQVGDVLVTSGLDGMYPAGLAVAKVVQVENVAAGAFGRVVCQPLAGIDRNRQLLIIMSQSELPPRPQAEVQAAATTARRKLPDMAPVPAPPLAPAPLPPQGAPAGQAAGQGPANAVGGVPVQGAAATPVPGAAATARPPATQPASPAPARVTPAAPATQRPVPAATTSNPPAQVSAPAPGQQGGPANAR
ncbi:rod shape-determining protein MreC [Massilia yuzhufengensis]|uniref:Cell shape-determining protein MreC n=1 Tax=Massilia yuzhufengensis TaxID=1164594 RepID=A0A1I1KKQ4_9BURK|nr:rod shape-determining protein MreC [Massilia yuzhufengensis]SFC61456.1 rod shape-determining protein MreC [Massilia yuzhufengensis]